jgi:cyclic nucleotide-binding protein
MMQKSLIVAQILALTALLSGLQFLYNTTGGTLFLFATIAPVLVGAAVMILVGALVYAFRKSHSLFRTETYTPGQVIFREGEPGDCAYFIRAGEVEVVQGDGTAEKVVARLSAGQYFGEMALIRNAPRNATVRAASESTVAVLGKQNFVSMLNLIPSTQVDIMKTVNERAQAAGK